MWRRRTRPCLTSVPIGGRLPNCSSRNGVTVSGTRCSEAPSSRPWPTGSSPRTAATRQGGPAMGNASSAYGRRSLAKKLRPLCLITSPRSVPPGLGSRAAVTATPEAGVRPKWLNSLTIPPPELLDTVPAGTLMHRSYRCPALTKERSRHADPGLTYRASLNRGSEIALERGLMPSIHDRVPPPCSTTPSRGCLSLLGALSLATFTLMAHASTDRRRPSPGTAGPLSSWTPMVPSSLLPSGSPPPGSSTYLAQSHGHCSRLHDGLSRGAGTMSTASRVSQRQRKAWRQLVRIRTRSPESIP